MNWFAVVGDYNNFQPKKDLPYEYYVAVQKAEPCSHVNKMTEECGCTKYESAQLIHTKSSRKKHKRNNRKCANCGHVHRILESYEGRVNFT